MMRRVRSSAQTVDISDGQFLNVAANYVPVIRLITPDHEA